MARSPEAAGKDRSLAARAPKPERSRVPKAPEAPENVILEAYDDGTVDRAPDQREITRESYTESGERIVAEAKARVEQRFGGFFASVRTRMGSITSRAKEAFFGGVGVAADVKEMAGKTAHALADVGKSLPEMGLEAGRFVYGDVVDPVFVKPAMAIGEATYNQLEKLPGKAADLALRADGAFRAGKERLEGVSLQGILDFAEKAYLNAEAGDEEALAKIDAAITNARQWIKKGTGTTHAAAQKALRNLQALRTNFEIAQKEKAEAADAKKRAEAVPLAKNQRREHSDVLETVPGASALLTELRNKSLDAQEAYEDAMTALDAKLRESFTFTARMKVRLEMAKTKMRHEVNKAFDDRILGQAEKEHAAEVTRIRAAMDAQREIDEDPEIQSWFQKAA